MEGEKRDQFEAAARAPGVIDAANHEEDVNLMMMDELRA